MWDFHSWSANISNADPLAPPPPSPPYKPQEGHVWNFHSWNDVWMRREEDKYTGWQALDGTPKGLGAAPVKAVYDLVEGYVNDTSTLISSVCEC